MPNTISPNMGLIVPTVGQEPGPTWASDINADLSAIDQHDHSSGSGVPVNTNGININADLPMHGNNLTGLKTINFNSLLAPLPGLSPNLGAVYVAGNELYYNDEAGNVVQITNGGSVNAGAGSITGLPSGTASASYSSGSQTFIWQSATSTPANMDGGSFIFREVVSGAKGVTVSSPGALVSDYQMFWPGALPGSTKILTLDSSGNIGDVLDVDNVTLDILSNQIEVKNGGITRPKQSAVGQQISASSGTFTTSSLTYVAVTSLNVTITTSGRPVMLLCQNDPLSADGEFISSNISTFSNFSFLKVDRTGSSSGTVFETQIGSSIGVNGVTNNYPGSVVFCMDPVSAGTYTYTVFAKVALSSTSLQAFSLILTAYEL